MHDNTKVMSSPRSERYFPEWAARFIVPAILCATWPIAWFVRQRLATPDTDKRLYVLIVAGELWEPLADGDVIGFLRGAANTGQYGPLFPMLSAPLSPFGPDAVVLAQFPLLVLLSLILFATMRRYRGPRAAAVTVGLTVLTPPVFNVVTHGRHGIDELRERGRRVVRVPAIEGIPRAESEFADWSVIGPAVTEPIDGDCLCRWLPAFRCSARSSCFIDALIDYCCGTSCWR